MEDSTGRPLQTSALAERRAFLAGAAAALPGLAIAAGSPLDGMEGAGTADRAFNYLYPLHEMSRAISRAPRGQNVLGHRADLTNASNRQVTMPNNDCLYSSAFLELSSGPLLVYAGDALDRYWSIAFMSAFTDNFAFLGTRATGGRGGQFLVAGPDWGGRAPAGTGLIRAPTNDVWMLGRILVTSDADLPAARRVQQAIGLEAPHGRPPRPLAASRGTLNSASALLDAANEMLGRGPLTGHARRARQFAEWGVAPGRIGAFPGLSGPKQAAWEAAIQRGLVRLRETYFQSPARRGQWAASGPEVGDFGTNDASRAAVALGGIAALSQEEAMYYLTANDSGGQALRGDAAYTISVPKDLPLDGFWSLTLYEQDPDGRFFFVDNPLNRYAISDRTPGVTVSATGSIDIVIRRDPPADAAVNWLPSANRPLRLAFRAYLPRRAMRSGAWTPPAVHRL
jgi:hypothetical protein